MLAALGRHNEALSACDRAIALDPHYTPAWANNAAVLHALGREDEAREAEMHAHGIHG